MIDTPGISFTDDPAGAKKEIDKWKEMTAPTPYAILLAIRCDEEYTHKNYRMYTEIKRLWGDESAFERLVVVFTFGDRQDGDIKQTLKTVCEELKNVLKDVNNRYIVFDAKASEDKKKKQTKDLFEIIERQGN